MTNGDGGTTGLYEIQNNTSVLKLGELKYTNLH